MLSGIIECVCGEKCYATLSYTQRKNKPRHVTHIYKCRTSLTDRTQKHVSISAKIADTYATGAAFGVLVDGALSPLDASVVEEELDDVKRRSDDVQERFAHVNTVNLNPRLKLAHCDAYLQLIEIEQELAQLQQERNSLIAQQGEEGALSEFINKFRGMSGSGLMELKNNPDLGPKFFLLFKHAWEEHALNKRRDILSAAVRIKTNAGGRGIERLEASSLLPFATD